MCISRTKAVLNLLDYLPPVLKIVDQLEFDLDVRVKELQDMKLPFTKQKDSS